MSLRAIRKERGLSLEAVGYLAGVDQSTVSRIERGLVEPERQTVVKLARALGISVSRMKAILEGSELADAAS